MRTAEEIINEYPMYSDNSIRLFEEAEIIDAINEVREEAIQECAEKAKAQPTSDCYDCEFEVDKESILSLINELK